MVGLSAGEMTMARYRKRRVALNTSFKNEELFESRGVQQVKQYVTPEFKNPTEKSLDSLEYVSYIWKAGDRYFKLAQKYYNDHRYWYIIALFNKIPTEAQLNEGDEIKIPTNLAIAIEVLD